MKFHKLRTALFSLAAVAVLSPSLLAQQAPAPSASHNWTTDQIITATVHQAWILSGKDEATFFEIIKELSEISATNRHLILPDNAAAGKRAGAYVRAQAKLDHDQLLYAIVDKSVRMTGTKAPAPSN